MPNLFLTGSGRRVRSSPPRRWPEPAPTALAALSDVLSSGRWAISGTYQGQESWERRFARAFAAFHGVPHCVPVASGTAGLMVALESCGVGAGAEVIIPGLTWVANASTVAGVNAVPVPVDIDPDTLCLDPVAVERAVTSRTAAIVAVHLYSALADLGALTELADRCGIPLIEDCSQAHGARYGGDRVGTFGAIGVFSMQHSKLLTCGEGGALITSSADLARRAEHLRADGRCYLPIEPAVGQMELTESAEIMGSNRCLSEFQAAVLLSQLTLLDEQNDRRRSNSALLEAALGGTGLRVQSTSAGTTARTFYEWAMVLEDEELIAIGPDTMAAAISAEFGGALVTGGYPPMNDYRLYRPDTRPRFNGAAVELDLRKYDLPVAQTVGRNVVLVHHSALLGDDREIQDLVDSIHKVVDHRDELSARFPLERPAEGPYPLRH